jgi:hypothetical protein
MSVFRLISTPSARISIYFSIFYLITFQYCRSANYRDPTSFFFDRNRGYQRLYSQRRIRQANDYIHDVGTITKATVSPNSRPLMCVGIVTVQRREEQYVSTTVGSLLEGLDQGEREAVYLTVLIAHTDQSKHPVHREKWVEVLPNKVLMYEEDDLSQIQDWEEHGLYRNKTIFDYTYLLRDCYNTGARYVTMIEDDTLAVRGWYDHALQALEDVEARMKSAHPVSQWVYLRLFYTEDLFGWNTEFWALYLFWSTAVWALVSGSLVALKIWTKKIQGFFSYTSIAVISCIFTPAFIALYFMAGRNSVRSLSNGIHEMNRFGCCSQGFIFPREIIPQLLDFTDLTTDWLVDMMIEQISDEQGWYRWATVPSLLQHIGITSSKGSGFDEVARDIWNFGFEVWESNSGLDISALPG